MILPFREVDACAGDILDFLGSAECEEALRAARLQFNNDWGKIRPAIREWEQTKIGDIIRKRYR